MLESERGNCMEGLPYIQTFRSWRVEAGVGMMQESQVVKPNLDADLYNRTRMFEATSYIHR